MSTRSQRDDWWRFPKPLKRVKLDDPLRMSLHRTPGGRRRPKRRSPGIGKLGSVSRELVDHDHAAASFCSAAATACASINFFAIASSFKGAPANSLRREISTASE